MPRRRRYPSAAAVTSGRPRPRRGDRYSAPMPIPHAAIDLFAAGPARLRAACADLTVPQRNARVAPGTWSIQEVVVHLVDCDAAVLHRMRRIVAEDRPLLVSFDEDALVARLPSEKVDLEMALALFESLRAFTSGWLRTLSEPDFERAGVHTQRGLVTLRQLVEVYAGHVDHHLAFVRGKRATLGVG